MLGTVLSVENVRSEYVVLDLEIKSNGHKFLDHASVAIRIITWKSLHSSIVINIFCRKYHC